jgi:hypothetical protein
MRRISTFPNGRFGAGLLLLRGTVGATFVALAWGWLAEPGRTPLMTTLGIAIAGSGVLVVFGVGTRLAVLAGLLCAGVAIWWSPASGAVVLNGKLAAAMVAAAAAAVALVGPGAHSLDARLFGRREINFPRHDTSKRG